MKTLLNLSKVNPMTSTFEPLKALLSLTPFDLDIDTNMMREIIEELEYRSD